MGCAFAGETRRVEAARSRYIRESVYMRFVPDSLKLRNFQR